MLIRFAGPRLAERPDPLLPVALRAGERQLGGALSWDRPQALAPFPEHSPFAGLVPPDEVTVERSAGGTLPALSERVLARLADGTPLVTAVAGHGADRRPRHRQCRMVEPAALRPVRDMLRGGGALRRGHGAEARRRWGRSRSRRLRRLGRRRGRLPHPANGWRRWALPRTRPAGTACPGSEDPAWRARAEPHRASAAAARGGCGAGRGPGRCRTRRAGRARPRPGCWRGAAAAGGDLCSP